MLALSSVASFMVVLDMLVVATALRAIQRDLGASLEDLEWTLNAYTLSFEVSLMTGAVLGDRYGRRRTFAAGLGAVRGGVGRLRAGPGHRGADRRARRAGRRGGDDHAVGAGAAGTAPSARTSRLGDRIYGNVTGLAAMLGPVLGGAIRQGIAWQWIFWLNVPIGLIAIPLVVGRIRENFGPAAASTCPASRSPPGAAVGLMWGLSRGNPAGWGSAETVATLAGGAVLTVAFVAWELRARVPMLPMRLFRSRAFSAGLLAGDPGRHQPS